MNPLSLFGNDDVSNVTLQLKWYHQFQFAGYYAAKEKGFYKEAGLDVKIIEGRQNSPSTYRDVINGNINYGTISSNILLEKMRNAPVVALGSIFQHAPDVLVMKYDKAIKGPSDLIHKKIMLAEVEMPAPVKALFLKEHIPLSEITQIQGSGHVENLINGNVDAITAYATDEVYQIESMGIKTLILYPHDYGIDFYGDILFTSEQELKEHPERVFAFTKASFRGWQYAMDHTEEVIDIILNLDEVKSRGKLTKKYLRFEAEKLKALMLADIIPIGHMNPTRWEKMAKTYVELGMHKGSYSLDGFIYDLEQFQKDQLEHYVIIIFSSIGVVIVILSILIGILRRMVQIRTKELNEKKEYLELLLEDRTKLNEELERKLVELSNARTVIQKSEKKYKDLVENSQEIIFSLDSNRVITTINKAVMTHLQYKPNQLIGKSFFEILFQTNNRSILELNIESAKEEIKTLVNNGGSVSFTCEFKTSIGEPKEMNVKLEYIPTEGGFVILGKASTLENDILRNLCESETQVYYIGNYLYNVDLICQRLSSGISKYAEFELVQDIRLALREMIINAIEHGNLDISYDEKSNAIDHGTYFSFISERQKDSRFKNRKVRIEYSLNSEKVKYEIQDEGNGFEHKKMLSRTVDELRLNLGHGRGILMTKTVFDIFEYNPKGNSVFLEKYFK